MFGSGYAELINKIALEKLWYDYNYNGAMQFLKDCFEGITDDICHLILREQVNVEMNKDNTEIFINEITLKEGKDVDSWYYNKVDTIIAECKGKPHKGIFSISDLINNVCARLKGTINFSLTLDEYIEYRNNKEIRSELFNELKYKNDDIFRYEGLLKMIQDYIQTIEKCFYIATKLSNDAQSIKIPSIYYQLTDYYKILINPDKLDKQGKIVFEFEQSVKKYIDNTLRLNELTEIKSTNELCDAGWIDRKGNYYGLNGNIANFLHLRLAELLIASRIIHPHENPERWLEENGWVKQHYNELQYYGYYNDLVITKEQKLTIKKLLSQKYNMIDLQGNKRQIPISKWLEIDDIQMRNHFA